MTGSHCLANRQPQGLTSETPWPPIRRVRRPLAPAAERGQPPIVHAVCGQPPMVHAALGQPSRHLIAREVRVPPAAWEPPDVDNDLDRANGHTARVGRRALAAFPHVRAARLPRMSAGLDVPRIAVFAILKTRSCA